MALSRAQTRTSPAVTQALDRKDIKEAKVEVTF